MPIDPDRVQARRKAIGARLREERLDRGLTQLQLADLVPLDRAFISNVEGARVGISVDRLCDIADALGIHAWQLLADVPKMPRSVGQSAAPRRDPRKGIT